MQGCLASLNLYNKVGQDHFGLVKAASAAVVSKILGLFEKKASSRSLLQEQPRQCGT